MKTKLLFILIILSFLGQGMHAQNYTWRWAKAGGGENKLFDETTNNYYEDAFTEEIIALKTDSQSNTYALSNIAYDNTNFAGISIDGYFWESDINEQPNTLLLKVDCAGNHLWHKVFGGSGGDQGRGLGVDVNDNVYVSMRVLNRGTHDTLQIPDYDRRNPVHFSADYTMEPLPYGEQGGNLYIYDTIPSPANKSLALIKYNTEGQFQWLRMPQSDSLPLTLFNGQDYGIAVEPNGNIHWMVGLGLGTHLDGQITVSDVPESYVKYFILKYNSSGDFLGYIPLPLTPPSFGISAKKVSFRYDPLTQQYYLGYYVHAYDLLYESVYINNELAGTGFLACFNTSGALLWKKEAVFNYWPTTVTDVLIDNESNVYVAGLGSDWIGDNQGNFIGNYGGFGGYAFTTGAGRKAFVVKYNAQGTLLWGSNAGGNGDPDIEFHGTHQPRGMSINGNELALGCGMVNQNWGSQWINDQPTASRFDPVLVRLNKNTGECIAINQIHSLYGAEQALTAVDTDPEGNYVVGGYMRSYLFANFTYTDPIIGQLNRANPGSSTDFFLAKLAKTNCSYVADTETWSNLNVKVYPNPTSDFLHIDTNEDLANYEIYNVLGQEVKKDKMLINTIDLSNLPAETYFIKLTTQQGNTATVKVIKK